MIETGELTVDALKWKVRKDGGMMWDQSIGGGPGSTTAGTLSCMKSEIGGDMLE